MKKDKNKNNNQEQTRRHKLTKNEKEDTRIIS